jgi:hypothetical protein
MEEIGFGELYRKLLRINKEAGDKAMDWEFDEVKQLRLEFPSGDTASVLAEIRHIPTMGLLPPLRAEIRFQMHFDRVPPPKQDEPAESQTPPFDAVTVYDGDSLFGKRDGWTKKRIMLKTRSGELDVWLEH